jgi:hypothetical protein
MRSRFPFIALTAGILLAGCSDSTPTGPDAAAGNLAANRPTPSLSGHTFIPGSNHPFFPLVPGTTFHYQTHTPDGLETDAFEVTTDTKTIQGVTVAVIHDVASLNGEVIEDTFDWFAQDDLGNVWYFGEDTHTFQHGRPTGSEGSWEAGVNGAQAGIIMEAHPKVGDTYGEEFAPGVAEDKATVVSLSARAEAPYGTFHDCLKTRNFTPLEPGAFENKYYCANIGLVGDVDLDAPSERNLLVSITRP